MNCTFKPHPVCLPEEALDDISKTQTLKKFNYESKQRNDE